MVFKILLVCTVAFAITRAGFLNIGQSGGNSGNNGGSSPGNGNFGFQQQVPLTLNPGPIAQSSQSSNPHSAASITASFSSQGSSGSFNPGPAATSSSFRQQHVNSVPATITTHGVATSYVAVPAHGFFGGSNGGSNNNNNNGVNSNNNGPNNGGGYGYGYSFSSTGGNSVGSSNDNQGNNGVGYTYGFGGNGAQSSNAGFSG